MINKKRTYLLFTPSISNLGGAQLYILRRANYLIKKGYTVKILVSYHNINNFILKKEFESIPFLFLKELQKPVSFYSKEKLNLIIHKIDTFLEDALDGIIESSSLETAVWGEIIASKFQWKHIIYLLGEPKISSYIFYPGYKLFQYKLNKAELYGTSEHTLPLIFEMPIERKKNNYINIPFDTNELADQSIPSIEFNNLDDNSFVIGTICRLEKPYLKPFIVSCIFFAEKHKERNFIVIIAGGSIKDKLFNELKNSYSSGSLNIPNLTILFTGYVKVLGKDFFKRLHVFVGMGTASINAISQSCATLNIDPITNKCSGIFGIDIENFAYPQDGRIFNIEDKLEELMLNKELLQDARLCGKKLFEKEYSIENSFRKLDLLIYSSMDILEHYPFKIFIYNRIKDMLKFLEGKLKTEIYRLFIYFKNAQVLKSLYR